MHNEHENRAQVQIHTVDLSVPAGQSSTGETDACKYEARHTQPLQFREFPKRILQVAVPAECAFTTAHFASDKSQLQPAA